VLYAQSYYTILPNHEVNLVAEIKDENGNTYDYNGTIDFSIITDPANTLPVGSLNSLSAPAVNGVANCIFTAISAEDLVELGGKIEGTKRIQASATVGGNYLFDTVDIRVTTGPVAIIIEPATEEDKSRLASTDSVSTINLKVVKADYIELVEYLNPITLSAKPVPPVGTLSTTTISEVPTTGTSFTLRSNGTAGVVEITASAPDLDMGYTEITFTGPPYAILVSTPKKSIYPSEETTIKVTIVDEYNTPVSFGEAVSPKTVVVSDSPDEYGALDGSSGSIDLIFEGEKSQTCVFTATAAEMGFFPQEIKITADDNLEDLNQGFVLINILNPLVAHHIFVSFDETIELDNDPIDPSIIFARMLSEEGDPVSGSSIFFNIKSGPGSFPTLGQWIQSLWIR